MQALLYTVAALACPIGMGLMMWMMMRGQRHDGAGSTTSPAGSAETGERAAEINALRAEIAQLKADRAARQAGGR